MGLKELRKLNEEIESILEEELKVGDRVALKSEKVSPRVGTITKKIDSDVVEVEFEAKETLPGRTDRYYVQELVKVLEESMEKVFDLDKSIANVENMLMDIRSKINEIPAESDLTPEQEDLFNKRDQGEELLARLKRARENQLDEDVNTLCDKIDSAESDLAELRDLLVLNREPVMVESFKDRHIEIEVEFVDGTTSDQFSVLNGTLLYGDSEIAELYNENDEEEIKDKIVTYCDLELKQEVEDVYFIGMEKSDDYYSDDKEQRLSDLMGEALDVEDNAIDNVEQSLEANGNEYKTVRTKQGLKNRIYANVDTKGIFHDEFWNGYRSILNQIKRLGYEIISGPANDLHHNNGYTQDGNEKAWDIQIEDPETHIQVRGQIKAQAAGTTEDPMLAYDMILILY